MTKYLGSILCLNCNRLVGISHWALCRSPIISIQGNVVVDTPWQIGLWSRSMIMSVRVPRDVLVISRRGTTYTKQVCAFPLVEAGTSTVGVEDSFLRQQLNSLVMLKPAPSSLRRATSRPLGITRPPPHLSFNLIDPCVYHVDPTRNTRTIQERMVVRRSRIAARGGKDIRILSRWSMRLRTI